jgi:hypothetical protein
MSLSATDETALPAQDGVAATRPLTGIAGSSLYRVVELMRRADGRLYKVASPWSLDRDRVEMFARQIASNTVAHRVWVGGQQGAVLSEMTLPPPPYAGLLRLRLPAPGDAELTSPMLAGAHPGQ